ncbi:MAG: hypothetical protein OXB84_02155, partial [Halobacteriovoraceae bacterium]|nr:hypothetical protein [Halobacteriovoraceae bacterium]
SKLILINSSAGDLSPFWRRIRPKTTGSLLRLFLWHDDPVKREKAIFSMVSNLKKTDDRLLDQMAGIQRKRPANRKNCLRQTLAAGRFKIPKINSVPVILFTSKQDGMVDPACSVKIAEFLETRIVWHPTAGHDLPLDDPDWLVGEVGKFVNDNSCSEDSNRMF